MVPRGSKWTANGKMLDCRLFHSKVCHSGLLVKPKSFITCNSVGYRVEATSNPLSSHCNVATYLIDN